MNLMLQHYNYAVQELAILCFLMGIFIQYSWKQSKDYFGEALKVNVADTTMIVIIFLVRSLPRTTNQNRKALLKCEKSISITSELDTTLHWTQDLNITYLRSLINCRYFKKSILNLENLLLQPVTNFPKFKLCKWFELLKCKKVSVDTGVAKRCLKTHINCVALVNNSRP